MGSRARPTSASSRTAWGDYGSARPDSQFDFGGQDGIRDDPDLSPNDNDSVYNGSGAKPKSSNAVATTGGKKSTSFFGKIGKGIRSLWATRQTEDVKGDRELHVKTTLRELIVYIVFLVILCIITFGMTSTTMYYYTKVMSDLFLDTTWTGGGSFRTITSVEDFWKFAKGPLMKGLYWETWYNNQSVPDDQLGYIYYENKLLGVPRLRQLQVHSNSCTVHKDFKEVIRECYESYAESLENKEPFGLRDNYTGWYYRTEDDLDGSSHWGLIASYSGAGYVQDLYRNKSQSEDVIQYLFDNRWIQRGTRIVFIDFTVYNANINLFCVVRLTVEFPPTGGAIPHATMRTVKLIRYVTVMDYFIMACEFIFCLFIIYYMIEEAIEIKKHKFAYFKNFWNILDIVVIVIALVCVVFNIYRLIKVNDLLSELLNKPDEYADFVFLGYGQTQFDNAIAIAVFFAWIKIFKYISFNKTMTQLSSTLGKCAKDLAGFAVMFFIIFLAFTQLGYLLFGTQVKDFSNFQNSFFTLFRIILGDFDFDQLEAANRVLGPIFFMLFVFFVFFVLINMFLAIINDTYSEVKGDMANQKNEFEMTDYFKRGYDKMISKLNFKHDKIVDIQKALHSADMNNDKQVDFDEWRHDLKLRGYADGEIEALFAKYDVDGDRVLDEEEQKRMQADLNDQKAALNKEYDEIEKMNRPESAHRSTSRASINDGSGSDSDDDDSRTKSSRSGPSQSVSYEEFTVLSRRVDRMEHSIGSIVSKIDAVLVKLELMEKAKLKRRETMGKILDSITESDGTSDEVKREQMERLVREELERWDSESSIDPVSGRGASPGSGARNGARSRSRPGSGQNSDTEDEIDLPPLDGKSDYDSDDTADIAIRVDSNNVSTHNVSGVCNVSGVSIVSSVSDAQISVSGSNTAGTNLQHQPYTNSGSNTAGAHVEHQPYTNSGSNMINTNIDHPFRIKSPEIVDNLTVKNELMDLNYDTDRKVGQCPEEKVDSKSSDIRINSLESGDTTSSPEGPTYSTDRPLSRLTKSRSGLSSRNSNADSKLIDGYSKESSSYCLDNSVSQPVSTIGSKQPYSEDRNENTSSPPLLDIGKHFKYTVLAPIEQRWNLTTPPKSNGEQSLTQDKVEKRQKLISTAKSNGQQNIREDTIEQRHEPITPSKLYREQIITNDTTKQRMKPTPAPPPPPKYNREQGTIQDSIEQKDKLTSPKSREESSSQNSNSKTSEDLKPFVNSKRVSSPLNRYSKTHLIPAKSQYQAQGSRYPTASDRDSVKHPENDTMPDSNSNTKLGIHVNETIHGLPTAAFREENTGKPKDRQIIASKSVLSLMLNENSNNRQLNLNRTPSNATETDQHKGLNAIQLHDGNISDQNSELKPHIQNDKDKEFAPKLATSSLSNKQQSPVEEDELFTGFQIENEKSCPDNDLEEINNKSLNDEVVKGKRKLKKKSRSRERKKDATSTRHKGQSVTTARGQKVTLGTLVKKTAGTNESETDNTVIKHLGDDSTNIQPKTDKKIYAIKNDTEIIKTKFKYTHDDLNKGQSKTSCLLDKHQEQYLLPKIQNGNLDKAHEQGPESRHEQYDNKSQDPVSSPGMVAPKREAMPLPVVPVGIVSIDPDTDAALQAQDCGSDKSGSARNQISTHTSCKTPVMEKVSTSVFV